MSSETKSIKYNGSDVKFTKTNRPYIMVEYTTSTGKIARRSQFIKMDESISGGQVGKRIGLAFKKPKVGGPGSVHPKYWSKERVEGLPTDLRKLHDEMMAKLQEGGALSTSGFFPLLRTLHKLPIVQMRKIIKLLDKGSNRKRITGIKLPAISRLDLDNIIKNEEKLTGEGMSGGIIGTLITTALPFVIKGLASLFKKKKKPKTEAEMRETLEIIDEVRGLITKKKI